MFAFSKSSAADDKIEMAILKKLDLFRSIGLEHKGGTIPPSSAFADPFLRRLFVFFFSKEIKENRSQKLATKQHVENLNANMIEFSFDIILLRLGCDKLTVGIDTAFDRSSFRDARLGEGVPADRQDSAEAHGQQTAGPAGHGEHAHDF